MKRFQKGDVVTFRSSGLLLFEFVIQVDGDSVYFYSGRKRKPLIVSLANLQDARKMNIGTLARTASNLSGSVKNLKERIQTAKRRMNDEIDAITRY